MQESSFGMKLILWEHNLPYSYIDIHLSHIVMRLSVAVDPSLRRAQEVLQAQEVLHYSGNCLLFGALYSPECTCALLTTIATVCVCDLVNL